MSLRRVEKRYHAWWILLYPFLLLNGAETTSSKLYDLPKAMVTYKISGGGMLSDDVNLTIEGEGKLRFKAWGNTEFTEQQVEEKTVGVLHYREERHMCVKRQEKQILDVDFHTRKIRERPIPKGKKRKEITAGLEKEGQQMVANIVCDMWKGRGVRRCIYKGILLFTEYRALGLFYREEAVDVQFDINVTDASACEIPSYTVEKFSLYTDSFKTRNKKSPTSFKERLVQSIEIFEKKGLNEEKLTSSQKQKLLNILAKPIYENQKQKLPELLDLLKKSRACLSRASNTALANTCMRDLVHIETSWIDHDDNRIIDWKKEHEAIMEMIEERIVVLQSRMKCIRAAKNFTDLAICMKEE
jgi:hypothetical protein